MPDFPGRVILHPMNARTTPPQGADRDRRTAEGMLLLTAFIWGGTFGATKLLLGGSLEPMGLLTWRFGIASVFFLLLYFSRIRRMITPRALVIGLVLGVLLYLGFGLQTIGLKLTSSSRSGFITALYVVMTPLLQVFFGRGAPAKRVWISVGLVMLGLWLLTTPEGGSAEGFNTGDLLTLVCAFSFAVYIMVLDRWGTEFDPVLMTALQLSTVFVLCALHCGIAEPWTAPSSPIDWALLLYLALLASVFTTWCQAHYQPRTTPSRAAIIYTMESVFAAIVGIALLNEPMHEPGYIGAALIIGGLLLVETGKKKENGDVSLKE